MECVRFRDKMRDNLRKLKVKNRDFVVKMLLGFSTKNKNDTYVENYNHYSYNLIILTILYIFILNR